MVEGRNIKGGGSWHSEGKEGKYTQGGKRSRR